MLRASSLILLALACSACSARNIQAADLPVIKPITRLLPPPGIAVPEDVRKELEAKLAELAPRIAKLTDEQHRPDIEVFTKAVQFALRFGEFYDQKDFQKARWALRGAEVRLALAEQGEAPWTQETGLVVRGYRSNIDGSVQPYGLVIPKDHDFSKRCPLYVWLHGRGDKETDLHFLYSRARNQGEIAPENAIVVHPFGRHCLGFKSAGERDVLDVVTEMTRLDGDYKIDSQRVVLIGFSMGGAGAWHLGAHYPNNWAAVLPGAGFAETARYQNLKPANYPPSYEQSLWGMYDVPCYVRNLFNVPLVAAYSGENDKQIQAARVMEEAYRAEGAKLIHLIGPGMGHQYHPDTKRELLGLVTASLAKDPPETHKNVTLQTRTTAYGSCDNVIIAGMQEHWKEARVDLKLKDDVYHITSSNVVGLDIASPPVAAEKIEVRIDGQMIEAEIDEMFHGIHLWKDDKGKWDSVTFVTQLERMSRRKWIVTPGPIDHAFTQPFMIVKPDKTSKHPRVQQWVEFEMARLIERWPAAFRGEARIKRASEVTDEDRERYHLVLFGDPDSNSLIPAALEFLSLEWTDANVRLGERTFAAETHVPLLVYPHPKTGRYIVLNSGPTFREGHDRTNSLQNPKLPDWAIVDITTPPDAFAPGKVVAADFFDDEWKVKK